MKRGISRFAGFSCSLLLFFTHPNAWSSSVISPLPSLGGSMMQVNGLNAAGQITGFSYTIGNLAAHAFLFSNGNIRDLGTLGGVVSQGLALNASGQVVGQTDLGDFVQTHAFLYTGANLFDLQTLGGSYSSASFVNDAGQVVGQSLTEGDGMMECFLFSNGTMINLGDLGGGGTTVAALNQQGHIAGDSYTQDFEDHAFLYFNGAMLDLGTLGGDYSAAFALNDSGMAVGESALSSGATHAFACLDGRMVDLGTLGGTSSQATAVNNLGQVIGTATTAGDRETHGFIYSAGTMSDLGTLGGGDSYPGAINNKGQVVGEATIPSGDWQTHAILWQNGTLADLNSLLPADSGWVLSSARFINDSGRIVGTGRYNGAFAWFVLDLGTANGAPIAVAGPDQTVECPAPVTLDASGSRDPDGDALAFEWSENGTPISTQAIVTTSLSPGVHVVTLRVSDPSGASSQTNVTIRVVDTTAPTILSSPGPITLSADANCRAIVPNVLQNILAADNCTLAEQLFMTQQPGPGTIVGFGQLSVAVTVADAAGNSAVTSIPLKVIDSTPPPIRAVTASPSALSPPNHQLVPVALSVEAGSECEPSPASKIISVTCNEATSPGDVLITGNLTLSLAASRTPAGPGRIYTITVECRDASGNASTRSVTVTVPKGNGK